MREFFARVLLQRLGPSKLHDIQKALTGANAAQLHDMAREVGMGGVEEIPATEEELSLAIMGDANKVVPKDLRTGIKNAISYLATQSMPVMSAIIGEILGEIPADRPNSEVWPANTLMILEQARDFAAEYPEICMPK